MPGPWDKYKSTSADAGSGPWSKYSAAPSGDGGAAESDIAGPVEAGSRSALKAATLGASKPIIAGVNAVIGNLIDAGFDSDNIKDFLSKAVDKENLKKGYNEDIARSEKLAKENPTADIAGTVAGVMAPVGPAAALAKIGGKVAGKAVAPLTEMLADGGKMASFGSKVLGGAAEGAGQTVLPEAAQRGVELASGDGMNPDAPSLGEVAAGGAKFGSIMRAAPEIAKGVTATAKSAGKGLLATVGGVKPKIISEYIAHQPDAVKAMSETELVDTAQRAVDSIKANLTTQRSSLSDDIVDAVSALKEKVKKGSLDSYDILERSKGWVKTSPMIQSLQEAKNGLSVAGKLPSTESARAAYDKINEQIALIQQYPKKIGLQSAKKIIQQFDNTLEDVSSNPTEFPTKFQQALIGARKSLDDTLKAASPEYRAHMLKVADDAQTLNSLASKFGDQKGAFGLIDQFGTKAGTPLLGDLKRLVDKTGKKNILQRLSDVQKLKDIERLTPQTVQPFLRSVMNEKSIENAKTLKLLSQVSGQDLAKAAKMTKLSGEFNKPFNAGSANVNLWAVTLGAIGGLAGHEIGGETGAAVGAVLGASARAYGPPTTKKILDGMAKIQGLPTIKKLDSAFAGLPKERVTDLKIGLTRLFEKIENKELSVDESKRFHIRMDIEDSKHLSQEQKEAAKKQLRDKGTVSGHTIRAIGMDD